MATARDPNELDQLARARQAKEAIEAAAELERNAVEAHENNLRAAVVAHLTRSGTARTPAELASELDAEIDAVRLALDQAVKAGTLTERDARYSAPQRGRE